MNLDQNIDHLGKRIEENAKKIDDNASKIHQNTGALAILKGFKEASNKFFIMWLITFIAFLGLLGYLIYIIEDTTVIEETNTQEIEQENESGDNNYIGRDGDING